MLSCGTNIWRAATRQVVDIDKEIKVVDVGIDQKSGVSTDHVARVAERGDTVHSVLATMLTNFVTWSTFSLLHHATNSWFPF
jgi:hypothetical protein